MDERANYRDDAPACCAVSPSDRYLCTLPPDHDGRHEAASSRDGTNVLEHWPRKPIVIPPNYIIMTTRMRPDAEIAAQYGRLDAVRDGRHLLTC